MYARLVGSVVPVDFGGLQKHEKTQHVLVGLGSSALEAAVALQS